MWFLWLIFLVAASGVVVAVVGTILLVMAVAVAALALCVLAWGLTALLDKARDRRLTR